MNGVRAFFIDGPDHGTTRTFESDPPDQWRTVGEVAYQFRYVDEATTTPDRAPLYPIHRYTRTYSTRKGVWIYEYDGIE